VYFQGYGWVAFNPTPPAARVQIPRQLDLLASATTTGRHGGHGGPNGPGGLAIGAILAALAATGVCVARRRTRRNPARLGQLLEDLVQRTGGHVQPSSTLAELGVELTRVVGAQTAALAIQAERARFAPDAAVPVVRPRIQIARTLAKDLGSMRTLIVLAAPTATRGHASGRRGRRHVYAMFRNRARRARQVHPVSAIGDVPRSHQPAARSDH
jgi:hypothetical protein